MTTLVFIFVLTALLSWFLVKQLVVLLTTRNIVDSPNERTLHKGSIPRGGGLAIISLLMLAVILIGVISARYAMFSALLISILAWSSLSWWDDKIDLSPKRRWFVQCFIAMLSVLAFGAVETIQLSNQFVISVSILGFVISVIGVLWLANLYNFMDGMDGLAASQTIIASGTLSFWFWQYGDQGLAIVCLVLAAASYGFLLWNWSPAKIFMGDVGSISIGAFLATMLLIAVGRYDMPVISFILLLSVFIWDATVTILRRLFKGEKIWLAHRSHYYQRLANVGYAHNKIVIGLILLMSISSLIATITLLDRDTILLATIIEILILAVYVAVVEYLDRNT